MPRFNSPALLALVVAACGAPAKPKPTPITNAAPATRYALQPLRLHGGEGRHSPWQSWTTQTGSLELAGNRAVLELRRTTESSPIFCPGGAQTFGRQQCAPPNSQPHKSTTLQKLTGDVRGDAGKLILDLHDDRARLSLACSDTFLGYACAITSHEGVFSPIGDTPSRLVFGPPAPRTYSLQPTKSATGSELTGSLTIDSSSTAIVVLTAGSTTATIRASVHRAPAGLVIAAGEPTSTLSLICDERDTELACDLTADRSVLGEPDHLFGKIVFVARR